MMAETKIEWADYTFNPWMGCTKVSPACAHCYAERDFDHRYGKVKWGPSGTRVLTSDANWKKPIKWNREAEKAGTRPRVFCASLADVFEDWDGHILDSKGEVVWNECANETLNMQDVRNRLFDLIDATPHLDWLLLTKRPENIGRMWPATPCDGRVCDASVKSRVFCPHDSCDVADGIRQGFRKNVWLGCSVECSDYLHRIDSLKAAGGLARFLFLSMEPVVGPMPTLGEYMDGIDWVIAGGESGPKARPSHVDWFRSIRDQCAFLEVPMLFKQWGEHDAEGNRVGKAIAGRMLDGRFHDEFPCSI